jgi:hypothetical protein
MMNWGQELLKKHYVISKRRRLQMKLKNVNMDLLDSDYQTIRITVDKNYAACNVLANENNFKKDYLFTESISHDLNNKDWLEQIMLIVDKFINDGRLDYLENNQELG